MMISTRGSMGAAVSAVATAGNLNDEDVAALENTYLRAKLDSASGAVLSQLLQQNLAEILESKAKAAAVESAEGQEEALEMALTHVPITLNPARASQERSCVAPMAPQERTNPNSLNHAFSTSNLISKL